MFLCQPSSSIKVKKLDYMRQRMAEQQNIRCRQKYVFSPCKDLWNSKCTYISCLDCKHRFAKIVSISSSLPRKIQVQISVLFKKVWLRCTHCITMMEWLSIHIGSQRNPKCIDKYTLESNERVRPKQSPLFKRNWVFSYLLM